jgi:hypothetical protein
MTAPCATLIYGYPPTRSIGIKTLAGFSCQSLEALRLMGKVLSAWELWTAVVSSQFSVRPRCGFAWGVSASVVKERLRWHLGPR